ncbi:hypothetical protein [Tropicimonas isoalkanivorans]|uniref:NADH:flavin oxidoreductase / NADH oxidase family protein n=1 Tax=Tropicimonas isoalkanivorans TaxID=441112 RepID=A0A1I1MNM5_9RHOB|nr:hypothetical protein [Tropicimonas isoalkanivorans]SFC86755.1 NADH:flavin oxidoreductase / NADH oxidase family protein [Tropicimonas isoalkanivorans]
MPHKATEKALADIIHAFGEAAYQAKQTGFDGVAVHGGHGNLIRSNQRSDRWGGSLTDRARLGLEVVREIRRRVGPVFPIMFRFSQWGWDYEAKIAANPAELETWLVPLADAGVDFFDAPTRRFWLPEFEGSDMNLAGWAKKITGKLAMTVGSVGLEDPLADPFAKIGATTNNLAELIRMLERGDFVLVAVGRALLANPDWANIVRDKRWDAIKPYDSGRLYETLGQARRRRGARAIGPPSLPDRFPNHAAKPSYDK